MQQENKENSSVDMGCGLIALSFIIVLIVTVIIIGFNAFSDDSDDDFNPYTEDYDGDGLGGDSDDHEILHQMPTMPTESNSDEDY